MKPILFNTEMVRAILDGRKTTTRRIIKPKCKRNFIGTNFQGFPMECRMIDIETQEIVRRAEPVYHVGDVLYVRETFNSDWCDHTIYKADGGSAKAAGYSAEPKWHPSIHMPHEAARIFLRVTGVRAERLQEIDKYWSNYDKEGMRNPETENIGIWMQEKFISIWDSTVKKADLPLYGWDANPWVWVIEFGRGEKPSGTA